MRYTHAAQHQRSARFDNFACFWQPYLDFEVPAVVTRLEPVVIRGVRVRRFASQRRGALVEVLIGLAIGALTRSAARQDPPGTLLEHGSGGGRRSGHMYVAEGEHSVRGDLAKRQGPNGAQSGCQRHWRPATTEGG